MNKLKVHFILEGFEENALFQIIDELSNINMIEMSYKNCKGGGNVPFYYQDAYASGNYDIIYCVYDVDFKSTDNSGMYYRIRKSLYEILGDEAEVNNVSLCTNPNTLLILLLGYDDIEN